jgi:hypothetical protein
MNRSPTSPFVSTNPTDQPITSSLPGIRSLIRSGVAATGRRVHQPASLGIGKGFNTPATGASMPFP